MPSSSSGGGGAQPQQVVVAAHDLDSSRPHKAKVTSSGSASDLKARGGSNKLMASPSSVSSHSNNSSVFRDDGFEDDLASSTASDQFAYHHHHRLSFQGRPRSARLLRAANGQLRLHRTSAGTRADQEEPEEPDEYQSCEELATSTSKTCSTASNLDRLSTTSSSLLTTGSSSATTSNNSNSSNTNNNSHSNDQTQGQHQLLDQISLANAKQLYRRSLLLEHRHNSAHHHHQPAPSGIQALWLDPSQILQPLSQKTCANVKNHQVQSSDQTPNSLVQANNLQKSDRTVNIIASHQPTRSPGYWDSNLSITQRVVTEIIETERTYVDDLEQIVTGYICYLRNLLKQQHHHQQPPSADQDNQSVRTFDELDNPSSQSNEEELEDELAEEDEGEEEEEDDDDEEDDVDRVHNHNQLQSDHEQRKLCQDLQALQCTRSPINVTQAKRLFSNLEQIYKFNKDLLFRLEECYLNPSSVAECFVENAAGFGVYTHYCTSYPEVVSTLTELMQEPRSAQLLKERQTELGQSLPLGAYLLKPVQRILKYHILFQSLIKHTNQDQTVTEKDRLLIGEAFSVMTQIAQHINAMKKRHEHAIRVQEVQGLLSGWQGPDLTTLGELILEDTFKLCGRPRTSRHLFLFDNVLLITKMKHDRSLCYKGHIACSNLMLIENIEAQPLVFNTVPFDNPKALCAFQARNLDKKRDWCLQIKELIIKSFEVKIPVHVKDILMSLTTNSTNGQLTNPESVKSSSSETNRALRAPNYLERKRTKQQLQQQQDKQRRQK